MELTPENSAPEIEPINETAPINNEQHSEQPEQPEQGEQPAGVLFDSIAYRQIEDIPRFIDSMNLQQAAMVILSSAAYSHKKGILTLLESEVLSKAIRVYTTDAVDSTPPEEIIEQPKVN